MRARSFAPKLCQNGRTLVSHRNLLCCVMPAVRLLPPDRFFDRSAWAAITRASPWRGIWLVAHAWIVTAVLLGAIGRAHVCTPVTNAQLVCRLLLEIKKAKV